MKRIFIILLLVLLVLSDSIPGIIISGTGLAAVEVLSEQIEPTLRAADFTGKLDKLLTLEMAAEISGFDVSKAEKEHDNKTQAIFGGEKKPPLESNYLWDNVLN
jgi:hypothetical protein